MDSPRKARQQRSACERCRSRRQKCDGKVPQCSRCIRSGHGCVYAQSLPIGRPRRSRVDKSLSLPSFDNLQVPSVQDPVIAGVGDVTALSTEAEGRTHSDSSSSGNFPYLESLPEPESDVSSLSATHAVPPSFVRAVTRSCACLDNMYLCLDDLQGVERLDFPLGLAMLHDCIEKATVIVQCESCPLRYMSCIQNSQLLQTVLSSMAEGYRTLLVTIDTEADRLRESNQTKTWIVDGIGLGQEAATTSSGTGPSFALDLNPEEWKTFARKAVKAEISGVADGIRPSFCSLLDQLEARQVQWHTTPCCPDFPSAHIHGLEKVPACVKQCRQIRQELLRLTT